MSEFNDYLKYSRALSRMATGVGAVGSNIMLSRIIGPGVITSLGTIAGGSLLARPIYQAGYGKKKKPGPKKKRKTKRK